MEMKQLYVQTSKNYVQQGQKQLSAINMTFRRVLEVASFASKGLRLRRHLQVCIAHASERLLHLSAPQNRGKLGDGAAREED